MSKRARYTGVTLLQARAKKEKKKVFDEERTKGI